MSKHSDLLGMNVATASHLLRMDMMFSLAQQLRMTLCHKCGEDIESSRDLSLDHIRPWRAVSAELFWDLSNVSFTHKRCNKIDRPARKVGPEGMLWCYVHKSFLPAINFGKDPARWNGARAGCFECENERQRRYDSRNPRHPCVECGTPMRKVCPSCKFEMPMKDYMAMRRREGVSY